MGFWGTFVVHRDTRPLPELLPAVEALGDAKVCHHDLASGWHVTQVFAGSDELPTSFLADVRDVTTAPALAAAVLDSDAALVVAMGRHTPRWQAWLNLDMALSHLVLAPSPFDDDGTYLGDDWSDPDHEREVSSLKAQILAELPVEAAAAAAVDWAAEAGLEPASVEVVKQVLDSHEIFVEDQLFALLNRLGLGTDDVEGPQEI